MHTALIACSDVGFTHQLTNVLVSLNFYVVSTHFQESALRKIDSHHFDVAIISQELVDGVGSAVLDFVLSSSFQTRVIFLATRGKRATHVDFLSQGADYVFIPPFDLEILKATAGLLRYRRKVLQRECLQVADQFRFYPEEGTVYVADQHLTLRRKESQILQCLLLHRDQVVTRDMIMTWVWGETGVVPKDITLDVYIKRLRIALGGSSRLLETIRGFGYRFNSV